MRTHGLPQAPSNTGVNADILIYVIVLLVVVNVVLICLYRRCSNKEIKDDCSNALHIFEILLITPFTNAIVERMFSMFSSFQVVKN